MMMQQQGRPCRPSPHNGFKASVRLVLRLCAIVLAFSSGIVMASSGECIPSPGAATFTYTRFGAFVFFVAGSITAGILEVPALYLQLLVGIAAGNETVTEEEEEKQRIGTAGMVLLVLDVLVPVLLFSAMVAAYVTVQICRDQIRTCAPFAGQVEKAKIMSVAACVAVTVAVARLK